VAAKTFTPWTYTADDGSDYVVRVADYISAQEDLSENPLIGGEQAVQGTPNLPVSLVMRAALVFDPVSKTARRVPCMDTTCELWTAADATIQLNVGQPPVLTDFNKYGSEGERSRHYKNLAEAT
jgi:hypothetical protein